MPAEWDNLYDVQIFQMTTPVILKRFDSSFHIVNWTFLI